MLVMQDNVIFLTFIHDYLFFILFSSVFKASALFPPGPNLHILLVRRSPDAPHLVCWIIFRQGPEIRSTPAVTGRPLLQVLVQEEVAFMQTLSKLDAEMGG